MTPSARNVGDTTVTVGVNSTRGDTKGTVIVEDGVKLILHGASPAAFAMDSNHMANNGELVQGESSAEYTVTWERLYALAGHVLLSKMSLPRQGFCAAANNRERPTPAKVDRGNDTNKPY